MVKLGLWAIELVKLVIFLLFSLFWLLPVWQYIDFIPWQCAKQLKPCWHNASFYGPAPRIVSNSLLKCQIWSLNVSLRATSRKIHHISRRRWPYGMLTNSWEKVNREQVRSLTMANMAENYAEFVRQNKYSNRHRWTLCYFTIIL